MHDNRNLFTIFSRVNVGLFCSTPGVALARAVPRKIALEMLLTGNPITATGKSRLLPNACTFYIDVLFY